MPTSRKLIAALGLVLGTASLTLAGSVPSLAATTQTIAAAPSAETASSVPSPNAPHVGDVTGARYGPGISINNPTSVAAFKSLHEQMLGHFSGSRLDLIHEYVGTSFNATTLGSQATQSVSTQIKPADPNTTLYTPTMYPSGGSCIEISTAYFYDSQVVAAWDWCQAITFVAEVAIDADFMSTYTQNKNYSVQIVQTKKADNTWTAYLYNYATATWEKFFTQNGTSQVGLGEGWDIYELYSNINPNGKSYACIDLRKKRVEAQGIMVGVDGSLVLADPTNAGDDYDVPLSQFQCPSLHYQMITQFNHWKARG
jgi:hypothetical protein